jgi:hypothetical protein
VSNLRSHLVSSLMVIGSRSGDLNFKICMLVLFLKNKIKYALKFEQFDLDPLAYWLREAWNCLYSNISESILCEDSSKTNQSRLRIWYQCIHEVEHCYFSIYFMYIGRAAQRGFRVDVFLCLSWFLEGICWQILIVKPCLSLFLSWYYCVMAVLVVVKIENYQC